MESGTKVGHYEFLSLLGKGGMGEVWRAKDTRLRRDVAIKVLPEEFSRDADHLTRFEREARAASALNHPNICIVHDLVEHDGAPFIVMELLRGENLAEKMARESLEISEALDLSMQLADALGAAHNEGIIHRDIKPANIFVTERGTAKLLDFGLARVQAADVAGAPTVDDVTASGAVLGTVSYMSPEQARGEELDARTDLFSLGVVLYEMTTGRPAFSGSTSAVIFDRLFHKVLESPTRINPKVPRELEAVMEKLLVKDRGQRPSSATELKDKIERIKLDFHSRRGISGPEETSDDGRKSIAILPFKNQSPDSDEYFGDGLADEIITDLSQIRMLRVISQNSSMQLKESGKDLKTTAVDLNVRYILEGTVRKAANAVRVTVRLIDPIADEHLWAEKYSAKLEDVFEIQEHISRQVVDALKMRLSPQEDKRLRERRIDNIEALECYHRARREIYKWTKDGLDRALELIQNALEIVGDNELLYAARGSVYRGFFNAAIPSSGNDIEKAEQCAVKVFALSPDSAIGHELMGMVQFSQGRIAESKRSYERALEIEPDSTYALAELPRFYIITGRGDWVREARSLLERARAVDPLNPLVNTAPFFVDLLAGHPEVVARDGPQTLRSIPEFKMLRLACAVSLISMDKLKEALDLLEAAPPETEDTIYGRLCIFLEFELKGRHDEALLAASPQTAGARTEGGMVFVVGGPLLRFRRPARTGHRLAGKHLRARLHELPVLLTACPDPPEAG